MAFGAYWVILSNSSAINDFALSRHGLPADIWPVFQDSLYRWIIYFSPYSRISEFILGVLICALYLDMVGLPAGKTEAILAHAGTFAGIAILAILHVLMFMPSAPFPSLTQMHMSFGYALPVALIMFCIARYENLVGRLLVWRPLVAAGEASYSLYFLHLIVVGYVFDYDPGWIGSLPVAGKVVAGIVILATAILLSLASYRWFEVPARNWFRKILAERPPRSRPWGAAWFPMIVSRGAVLTCLVAAPFSIAVLRVPPKLSPPPEGTIAIRQATYGASCHVPAGNVTASLIESCGGLRQCAYTIDVNQLRDTAPGCDKDFSVDYACSTRGPLIHEDVPGEAGLGSRVRLICSTGLRIRSATYGGNCGAKAGNATMDLTEACFGKKYCSYQIYLENFGDPAPGCQKDFSTDYACTEDGPVYHGLVPAEAGLGGNIQLTCPTGTVKTAKQ